MLKGLLTSETPIEDAARGEVTAWVVVPTGPAIVLGRHQDAGVLDASAVTSLGWEVLRRPTPGGAAYVDPSAVCVEVTIPASHPQARTDLVLATQWFAELLAAALHALALPAALASDGGEPADGLAAETCFGSWVRGELLLGGRKVFGTAQFRRQDHALFQGVALTSGRHSRIVAALAAPASEREAAALTIERRSEALAGVSPGMLRDSIRAVLEQAGLAPRSA